MAANKGDVVKDKCLPSLSAEQHFATKSSKDHILRSYSSFACAEERNLMACMGGKLDRGNPAGEEDPTAAVGANIGAIGGEFDEIPVEKRWLKSEPEEKAEPDELKSDDNIQVAENKEQVVEALPTSYRAELSVGDYCVACFSEDNTW